ncbi:aspartyl-phosphate phosphatase Spo0E family protein [Halonatronum saccharophilum]|uniref:aspartyl-phosphate phosphatase Spo0E family protein n=1 Tax=Halonatronum saccharophilum TaxID=150060 RepID=UPI0004AFA2EC|nr:aspartyl-phosphate phosphatase Spo0E family protein [Halonatronum saccharophilum]
MKGTKLTKDIDYLRSKMLKKSQNGDLLDKEVLKLSRILDKKILDYMILTK